MARFWMLIQIQPFIWMRIRIRMQLTKMSGCRIRNPAWCGVCRHLCGFHLWFWPHWVSKFWSARPLSPFLPHAIYWGWVGRGCGNNSVQIYSKIVSNSLLRLIKTLMFWGIVFFVMHFLSYMQQFYDIVVLIYLITLLSFAGSTGRPGILIQSGWGPTSSPRSTKFITNTAKTVQKSDLLRNFSLFGIFCLITRPRLETHPMQRRIHRVDQLTSMDPLFSSCPQYLQ